MVVVTKEHTNKSMEQNRAENAQIQSTDLQQGSNDAKTEFLTNVAGTNGLLCANNNKKNLDIEIAKFTNINSKQINRYKFKMKN